MSPTPSWSSAPQAHPDSEQGPWPWKPPVDASTDWDALVDCLSDLCGAAKGGVGIVGVIHDADLLLDAQHFPLFVSVLCQGADRANASVDLDGFPLDRPALSEHFHFEFRDFDPESIALRVRRPDLTVTTEADHVAAALNPEVWH
ncbi:hypothetical protein RKD32_004412 [Streptomyces sp. SAI-195]